MVNLKIKNVLFGLLVYIGILIVCILLVKYNIIPSIQFTNDAKDNNLYTRFVIGIGGIILLGSSILLIYPMIKD